MFARRPGTIELEHARLRVIAVPARRPAAEPDRCGLEAIQDRLVAPLVVGATEDEGVLDPHERLAKAPPLRQEGLEEGKRRRAAWVADIKWRPLPKRRINAGKRLAEKLAHPIPGIARDPKPGRRLSPIGNTERRIRPEQIGALVSEQGPVGGSLAGIAAEQAMGPELVEIAPPRRGCRRKGRGIVLAPLGPPQLCEQGVEVVFIVACARELGKLLKELRKRL